MERRGEGDIDTLSMVLDRFHRSEEYCAPWHEQMKEWYKRYRSYSDPQENPYSNNVFNPLTYTLVETHVARMMLNLFAVDPFGSVIPIDSDADPAVAKQMEKALSIINGNPESEFFLEYQDFEKQNAIMGTSFMNILPKFDFREVAKKSKKKAPYFFDGVQFETQEAMDCFPDPAGRRLTKCKYFIKRDIMYVDDLLEMEKDGIYSNVKGMNADGSHIDDKTKERLSEIGYTTWDEYLDAEGGKVEVLTYFQEGHIINVAGRQRIIRDTRDEGSDPPLPYAIPMIDNRFCPVPREFFGVSIPEIMKDLQDSLNLIESQRLDNIEMILNKMWIYRANSITAPEDLISFPGNAIPEDNPGDVRPVEFSDVLGSAYEEAEAKKYAAQDAVGEQELARGNNLQNERTATGIMRLQEATLIRHDVRVKTNEMGPVRMTLKKEIQIIRQFCPQEQYERMIGEKDAGLYEMSVDDIFDAYDIKPVGSSVTANKELRAYQIQQAQEILMNVDPAVGETNVTPFRIDMYEVLKLGLDPLDVKNFDELVPKIPEEELAQMEQEEQAMAEQQQQQPELPPELGGGSQLDAMMQVQQQPEVPMPLPILPDGIALE